jgi:phosphoglycolate phosphatase-like HAD superfamily hydrolase
VGDTPRDLQAAKNAGVRCLGVATGKFSVAELHEASQQCGGANTQVILEGLSDVDRVMEYFGLGEGRGSKSET